MEEYLDSLNEEELNDFLTMFGGSKLDRQSASALRIPSNRKYRRKKHGATYWILDMINVIECEYTVYINEKEGLVQTDHDYWEESLYEESGTTQDELMRNLLDYDVIEGSVLDHFCKYVDGTTSWFRYANNPLIHPWYKEGVSIKELLLDHFEEVQLTEIPYTESHQTNTLYGAHSQDVAYVSSLIKRGILKIAKSRTDNEFVVQVNHQGIAIIPIKESKPQCGAATF